MTTTNPIGVISMFYARPFTRDHFDCFTRIKKAGADVVELLVPEPGELDLGETRKAIAGAGLTSVLAARVNLSRDLAGADEADTEELRKAVVHFRALFDELLGTAPKAEQVRPETKLAA